MDSYLFYKESVILIKRGMHQTTSVSILKLIIIEMSNNCDNSYTTVKVITSNAFDTISKHSLYETIN